MSQPASHASDASGVGAGSTPDPFAMLGLAPSFDVPAAELERAFHEQSKLLHPDRFAQAPAAERVAALSRARALNDAYQVLRKPASRAEHLLARAGVVIGDRETLDPTFLMEILDLREALAEARIAGDLAAVARMQGEMAARRGTLVASLSPALAAGAHADAKCALIALRYVDRYLEECDAALDQDA